MPSPLARTGEENDRIRAELNKLDKLGRAFAPGVENLANLLTLLVLRFEEARTTTLTMPSRSCPEQQPRRE